MNRRQIARRDYLKMMGLGTAAAALGKSLVATPKSGRDRAKTSAAVAVPDKWFEDHFAHQPIWDFLSQLDIPVGCFHGGMDNSAPIAAVRALEKKAKSAKKTKMKFVYFDDLDHTLNIAKYFAARELPAGHKAIFQFIDNCLPERDRTNR